MTETTEHHKRTAVLLCLLTSIGLALRLWHLGKYGYWIDEIMTYRVISEGWDGLGWRAASTNSMPPLYFAIARIFWLVSPTEYAMRLPSALCGALAIPVFYALCARVLSRPAALVGALLLTFSPFHLWFSQDARPYSLLMLLALTSTLFMLRALEDNRRRWWFGYILVSTLCLYVHVVTSMLFLFQIAYVLILRWRDWGAVLRLIGSLAVVSLFFGPILPMMLAGMREAPAADRPFAFAAVPYTFYAAVSGFTIGPPTALLHHFSFKTCIVPYLLDYLFIALAFIPCFVLGVLSFRKRREMLVLLATWTFVPITVLAVLSFVAHHAYNIRFISPVVFPILLTCAAGICLPRSARVRVLLLCLALACEGVSLSRHYMDASYAKEDYRTAAGFLETAVLEKDTIYSVNVPIELKYYYHGPAPIIATPGGPPRVDSGQPAGYSRAAVEYRLERAGRYAGRIWFVEGGWNVRDPKRYAKRFLWEHFLVDEEAPIPEFAGLMKITCYVAR